MERRSSLHVGVPCRSGAMIRFGERRAGGRAYLAFAGGVDVPPVLGSRATHTRTGFGGVDGRAIRAGDRIPLGRRSSGSAVRRVNPWPIVSGGARLRVLPGPQDDFFPPAAFDVLHSTRFTIASQSDRMGYRLAEPSSDSSDNRSRDDLGRHVYRRSSGTSIGSAHSVDGRSSNHRGLSADRRGDHG